MKDLGFSNTYSTGKRKLYEDGRMKEVDGISPYLIEGDVVFAESRKTPVCNVPEMIYGNKPTDGGFLFFTEEEKMMPYQKSLLLHHISGRYMAHQNISMGRKDIVYNNFP